MRFLGPLRGCWSELKKGILVIECDLWMSSASVIWSLLALSKWIRLLPIDLRGKCALLVVIIVSEYVANRASCMLSLSLHRCLPLLFQGLLQSIVDDPSQLVLIQVLELCHNLDALLHNALVAYDISGIWESLESLHHVVDCTLLGDPKPRWVEGKKDVEEFGVVQTKELVGILPWASLKQRPEGLCKQALPDI
jgi:hypothetical protein